jgi:general L-amino acid transport system substrate-binding protein
VFKAISPAFLALALAAGLTSPAKAGTIETIKQRGQLICGVNTGNPGFAQPDSKGTYTGFEVDQCRAVAAAITGKADNVKYVPLTSQNRFTALQSGEVDMLARSATWSLTRESQLGLAFPVITFYDGQAFMVNRKLGVKSAKDLKGATVCALSGSTSELNLADFSRANHLEIKPVSFDSLDAARDAFLANRCDSYTTDMSGLAATRAAIANPDDYVILPEVISREPISVAVRQDDLAFIHAVRWTMFAMIEAEELGITSANIDQHMKDENPETKRLLGVTPGLGTSMGLTDSWAVDAIRQVGNYAESFERNLGAKTPLKLERGLNELWSKGGA